VSAVLRGDWEPSPATLAKLHRAVPQMETSARGQAEHVQEVLEAVRKRCQRIGVREFAKRAGIDRANLTHVLSGQRQTSEAMLAKLELALVRTQD
jgi:predicted transcriptional regulator